MSLSGVLSGANAAIAIARNLGLPIDFLGNSASSGDVIDEIKASFAQLSAQIDALEEGINSNFLQQSGNAALNQIAQAVEQSSQVWLKLKNADAQSQASKALALEDARAGLSNTVNAVKSLVESQNFVLTPQVVQEIYGSLAFALSVQINVAATWNMGEKTDIGYNHGGFLPFKGEIEAGLDLLKSAETTLRSRYIDFGDELYNSRYVFEKIAVDGTLGTSFKLFRDIDHDFPTDAMTLEFFQGFRGFLPFRATIELNEGFVRLIFPVEFQQSGGRVGQNYDSQFRKVVTDWNVIINETLEDYFFFYLTGLNSEWKEVPLTAFYATPLTAFTWYEFIPTGFDELIAELEKSVDGITDINRGIGVGALDGTEGGDFLRGGDNRDVMRGFGDDDYLLGEGGDDDMAGLEGNDRYFGGTGDDLINDSGSADDFDVAMFEGSFTDYDFYEAGDFIKVVKAGFVLGATGPVRVVEVDTLKGIEALKFDQSVVLVENLSLISAPERPVIVSISDDTGVVGDQITSDGTLKFFGTAQANTTIQLFVQDASVFSESIELQGINVGSTVSDSNGNWTFDYTGTVLSEGQNIVYASVINDAGVYSGSSGSVSDRFFYVDKTGPTVKYAIASSSNVDPDVVLAGDTVTLDFEADGALLSLPTVTIGGLEAQVVENNIFFGQENTYKATVTLTASVLPGETLDFLIEMVDVAGNRGSVNTLKDRDGSIPGLLSIGGTPTVAAPEFTTLSDDTGAPASDFITSDGTLLILGTAEAGSTVELFLDGSSLGSVTATAGGVWSFDNTGTDLAEGRYTLGANATNAAGDVSGTKRTALEIDKTAPEVVSASLSSNNSISSEAVSGDVITLTFSLDSEIEGLPAVTLAGASAVVADLEGGDYRATVTLDDSAPEGAVTFQISATDRAGNVGSANAVTDGTSINGNNAPFMAFLPGTVSVTEDLASDLDLSALTLRDADATDELTVVLSASVGTLAAVDGTGVVVTGTGTAALTLVGTAAAIDTYLNTASAVQYTGAQDAAGPAAATLILTGDDGSGEVTFGTVDIDITNVNDAPIGRVVANGFATVGATLTATSALQDADGLGDLTFQWLREASAVTGATGARYVLGQADAGAAISVRVSYTDGGATLETVSSAATARVSAIVQVPGTDGNDHLIGTDAAERLSGGPGNDRIEGQGARDVVLGGPGNDYAFGDGMAAAYYGANIANQVYRLYQATLDRAPDTTGHAAWAGRLASGERTLIEVADGFVRSPQFKAIYSDTISNTAFVTLLYDNVLDRAPDSGGLARWVGELQGGASRAEVVLGFSQSPQFVTDTTAAANAKALGGVVSNWSDEVYRLFQATLDRAPDVQGFERWTGELASGKSTLIEVADGFVRSPQFKATYDNLSDTAFVTLLFNNVLGRDPDAQGFARWTGELADGASRAEVVLGFSQSPQFRAETAAGLKQWMRDQGTDDRIDGGPGSNLVAGGKFADVFVFNGGSGATTTVADLEPWDQIEFAGFGYDTAAAARTQMTQDGPNLLFSDQDTDITFRNTVLSDITDDMILV